MSNDPKLGAGQIKLTDSEFTSLCALIHKQFGIRLSEQKRTLLEGRLQSLLRQGGYQTFQEYYNASLARPNSAGLNELINRVSTNHTFFNRESSHFDLLTERVIQEVKQRSMHGGKKEFRLWCAAASTGQEPYLLAMLVMKTLGVDYRNWDVRLPRLSGHPG